MDIRDLNVTTPKDMYVMPITDMLVDYASNKSYFNRNRRYT